MKPGHARKWNKSRARRLACLLLAGMAVATAPAACAPQGVCAQHKEDVVGCGGHMDEIYRQIPTPASPG